METVILRAKTREILDKKIYEKIAFGWVEMTDQKKNFWGVWVVVMAKIKMS